LARQLLHVEHPNSKEIVSRQNQPNCMWSSLRFEQIKKEVQVKLMNIGCNPATVTFVPISLVQFYQGSL